MNSIYQRFKLRSSDALAAIFLFIHGGAVLCVYFITIIWLLKILLILCILTNLIVVERKYALLLKGSCMVEFWPGRGGNWYLRKYSGDLISATIDYPVFISNYLIIINFNLKEGKSIVSVPIFKNGLAKNDFRRLKVLLKIKAVDSGG